MTTSCEVIRLTTILCCRKYQRSKLEYIMGRTKKETAKLNWTQKMTNESKQ